MNKLQYPDHTFRRSSLKGMIYAVLTVILSFPAGTAAATGPDNLVFEQPEYDFGRITGGNRRYTHLFEFTNRGDNPVVILAAETSCSCVKTDHPRNPILPGESAVISATLNPRRQRGTLHKVIHVYTPDKPYLLILSAEIE